MTVASARKYGDCRESELEKNFERKTDLVSENDFRLFLDFSWRVFQNSGEFCDDNIRLLKIYLP